MRILRKYTAKAGLTLVEVTLAIGVFTFAMAILLGLLAPMLTDLSTVLDADETQAIVNKVELYLETFTDPDEDEADYTDSTFEDIYEVVRKNGYLLAYVYRTIGGQTQVTPNSTDIDTAMSDDDPDNDADRRVFLAVLYPSSVNPADVIDGPSSLGGDLANIQGYSLRLAYDAPDAPFLEGYLAFNVEIYAYAPPSPGDTLAANITNSPPDESGLLLSFPTAINR